MDDDFDPSEYEDVEGLSDELARAWDRLRRTAGWPTPVDPDDLRRFKDEVDRLGGIEERVLLELLEQHCGFDVQDWTMVLDVVIGRPPGPADDS